MGQFCCCKAEELLDRLISVYVYMQGVRQRGWEAIALRAICKVVEGEMQCTTLLTGK